VYLYRFYETTPALEVVVAFAASASSRLLPVHVWLALDMFWLRAFARVRILFGKKLDRPLSQLRDSDPSILGM